MNELFWRVITPLAIVAGIHYAFPLMQAKSVGNRFATEFCKHSKPERSYQQTLNIMSAQPDFDKSDYNFNMRFRKEALLSMTEGLRKCGFYVDSDKMLDLMDKENS